MFWMIWLYNNQRNFTIVWPCIVTDSLWIKPTDALNSNFIGITTLHVSGSLSAHHQEFLAVHRLWYILCTCDEPFATSSSMELLLLVVNCSSQLHIICQSRCTAKNSWWWAEWLPETCRVVIPIKLEFNASVGFIHTESVTMHRHTIVKKTLYNVFLFPRCGDVWRGVEPRLQYGASEIQVT